MKFRSSLDVSQTASLSIAVALLAGCSNSPASHFAPPPVRAIMKIRKLREKEANSSPSPSPASSSTPSSQPSSYNAPNATPVPGGIIGGIIERRLQQSQ